MYEIALLFCSAGVAYHKHPSISYGAISPTSRPDPIRIRPYTANARTRSSHRSTFNPLINNHRGNAISEIVIGRAR